MTSEEKKIEKKLRQGVESLGGLCLKFPATYYAGIPDRLCILPGGLVFFAELKGPGEKLRPIQEIVIRRLRDLGVKVHVLDSMDAVNHLLFTVGGSYLG